MYIDVKIGEFYSAFLFITLMSAYVKDARSEARPGSSLRLRDTRLRYSLKEREWWVVSTPTRLTCHHTCHHHAVTPAITSPPAGSWFCHDSLPEWRELISPLRYDPSNLEQQLELTPSSPRNSNN